MYCGPTKIATSPVCSSVPTGSIEVHHDEERRAVFLDLGPLVSLLRVLNRELVKGELLLQRRQLRRLGVFQRDPDKTVALGEMRSHLGQRNVGQLLAAIVGHTVDDHESARIIA